MYNMPDHLLARWRSVWQPAMYHGWYRRRNYFEGWYCKVVSPGGRQALAVIPGIAMDPDGQQQAFIQVLDGTARKGFYYPFAAADFRPSTREFSLQIGPNHFSTKGMKLDLPDFRGELQFTQLHPWPRTAGAPGVMGWYGFVPFMQCYHGVLSMDHQLSGTVSIAGHPHDFSGGRGYMEKDWGQSFPSSWIWGQSNHFGNGEPASLFFSVARIPWLTGHFTGFLCGLLWQGEVHRMATYTGADLSVQLEKDLVHLHLRDRRRELRITGRPGPGAELASPLSGQMTGKVSESLQAELDIDFRLDGRLAFRGTARHAGLEVAGPAAEELT